MKAFFVRAWRGAGFGGAFLLAGCGGVLDPKGPIGAANRTILVDSFMIMMAIIVPTIIAALVFAWWYRASNVKAKYLPDWEFSGRIELVVWSIPLMTILLLGGVAWIGSYQLHPAKPIEGSGAPLDVEVVSLDWKWLFIYPEQRVASVNRLVVPAGRPVHFHLTSSSVMNVFFVPQLGSMIYAMNGMTSELWLQADEVGRYYGQSAHFSGDGFPDMHFDVDAMPAEAFASWVNTTRDSEKRLDGDAYKALSKQSANVPVSSFGMVDIDLFDRIVTQDLPPGPGPALEHQGALESGHVKVGDH